MPKIITDVSWSATGLPTGVSIDEDTGTLTGTPSEAGEYTVPVTVETNYGRNSKNVSVNVKNPYWEKHDVFDNIMYSSTSNSYKAYQGSKMYLFDDLKNRSDNRLYVAVIRESNNQVVIAGINNKYKNDIVSAQWWVNKEYDTTAGPLNYCIDGSNSIWLARTYSEGEGTNIRRLYYYANYSSVGSPLQNGSYAYSTPGSYAWHAVCYSPTIDIVIELGHKTDSDWIVAIKNAKVYQCFGSNSYKDFGYTCRDGCLAWSPKVEKFCAILTQGVATSSDAINWSVNSSTLCRGLDKLLYRADLDKFFALNTTEKIFYVSEDGLAWEKLNNAPIPLSTIKKVYYEPSKDLYCAIGGTGQYVYFSRDMETWIPSKVADYDLTAQDVIYYPAADSWVFLPNDGVSIYTLDSLGISKLGL